MHPRTKDTVLDTKFSPRKFDSTRTSLSIQINRRTTPGGSTEEFREGEIQVEQISFGGDFPLQNAFAAGS